MKSSDSGIDKKQTPSLFQIKNICSEVVPTEVSQSSEAIQGHLHNVLFIVEISQGEDLLLKLLQIIRNSLV